MTRFALFASIALSAGSFALGYAGAGFVFLSVMAILFGTIWMYVQWRDLSWFSMAGLGLAVFAGAIGVFLGANSAWMYAGVSFSLFAWDLMEFRNRLKLASNESDVPAMERKHLLRLGVLSAAGTILFVLAVFAHLKLGLWALIFLAFITALGLAQLIWRLRPG
ncbi:MAG: hypothetical protein AB1649_30305 [Chloroflexota bacterium]